MNYRFIAVLFSILFLVPMTASAEWNYGKPIRQAGNIGVGFGAGTMSTLFSGKYFASDSMAFQGNIGWWRSRFGCNSNNHCGGGSSIAVSADVLWEMPTIVGNKDFELAWNFGAGAGVGIGEWETFGLGVSGVLGLEFLINVIPIDLVLEYRPGFLAVPGFEFDWINFTGHIRFYF